MRKVLICLLASAVVAPIATAGPVSGPVDVDFRKSQNSDWIEFTSVRKNVGAKKQSVFWRVKNRDSQKQKLRLVQDLGGAGVGDYKVRWFTGGDNVTGQVAVEPGYKFNLNAGEKRVFKVTLRAVDVPPAPLCVTPFFYVKGDPDPISYGLYVNDDGVCG